MSLLKPACGITMLLFFCLTQRYCVAQDKSNPRFGKVTPADFTLPVSPIIDTNTSAVILTDAGSVNFVGNTHNWFSYVFQRHTRIKIITKEAFDLATVSLILYPGWDEKADKIDATTYNLENGQVVETRLEKTDLFEKQLNKYEIEKKFTLPAVKEGSIIDFTYTITSRYYLNMPSWTFQRENYPTLWSEFFVSIPQTLFYVMVKQGVHAYAVDKGSEGHNSYKVTEDPDAGRPGFPVDKYVSVNTVNHQWVMKDIPAFHEEKYLSTPYNYLDKIEFQLSKTYNGEDYQDYKNSWKEATAELLTDEDFGGTLGNEDNLVSDAVAKATAGVSGLLEQAKAIYYYVSGHFTCTDYYNKYLKTQLRDVIKSNGGSVGDINLLLTAMLRKAGLHADPVVLSTREFGYNLASYPILQRLNYVIVRMPLEGKIYYLDAAHPKLGFGQLASDCYNGHARIISNTDSGSVYFMADSLREKTTTAIFISSTDKGPEGTWESSLGPVESYRLRERVESKGMKQYFKDIQTRYGEDIDISDGGIDSLERLEDPVKVHYNFRLRQPDGASPLYVSPFIGAGYRENPFKEAERKYPVEMPYAIDETYIFTMQIPDGYAVDELPKSARASLNGEDGTFDYLIGQQGGMVQLRCHLKLNKAFFAAADYTSLRDFFALVVKKESETIVLKKQ